MKKGRKRLSPFIGKPIDAVAYRTKNGRMYEGKSEDILSSDILASYQGKVNLIFTSPI